VEKENEEKTDLIMADGTKAHGLGKREKSGFCPRMRKGTAL